MKKLILPLILLGIVQCVYAQNFQISGGNNFSAAVCDNQVVYVWGANSSGQLGLDASGNPIAVAYRNTIAAVTQGNVSNVAGGSTIGALPAIKQADAGSGAHILGLSCTNQVWAWGDNAYGQLGRNNTTNSAVPQRVLRGAQASNVNANDPNGIFLNNIIYVSGGNNFSMAIESGTGRVLTWGENANGQLGDGSTTQRNTPVYVVRSAAEGGGFLTNIIQIEGGDDCAYALDANGYVWSWGDNAGNKLGRTGAGIQSTASRVIKGDPLNSGYSATPTPIQYLNNIVQISGGDTHGLGLDANGNVWSWGGDWGEGQLGRGGGSVYQDDARRVVDVGVTAYATSEAQFLGNGPDGKAIYVSAGQASSAVVLANGRVVTFGGRGLFNSGATNTPSGTITCPSPAGDMIPSGTIGDNNTTACNSTSCNGKATQWTRTPVYVRTTSGTILTGITQISDGDAWYFAITSTGSAYVWGWNRRGELGLGDYNDRCGAVSFTLPAGCALSAPCPPKPNLGLDGMRCPVFSEVLNSNVAQSFTSWKYTWEFRPGTTGSWSSLGASYTNSNNTTYSSANQLGQYRVIISDNRASVPFLCGPCPNQIDTITFSPYPNPYTVTGCVDNGASLAQFQVVSPAGSEIKWYTNVSGGTALNPANTNPSITVPFSSTNTTVPGCTRALFAEDISSITGTLLPATTTAGLATALGAGGEACTSGNWTADWDNNPTPRNFIMIEVTRDMTLTAASVLVGTAGTSSFTVKVYNNNPTGGPYCGTCTPAGNKDAPGTLLSSGSTASMAVVVDQIVQVPLNINLTGTTASPGKYWIGISGSNVQMKYFNCSKTINSSGSAPRWTNIYQDNTGQDLLRGVLGMRDNNLGTRGSVFNIQFQTGTGYACGRVLVCATGSCTLPVELLNFNVAREGNSAVLNWATTKEQNSSHFIIQKSSDGVNFVNAGTVNAAGNSSAQVGYSFRDEALDVGTTYYRLAQYDVDGEVHYSEIRSVNKEGISGVKIVPNPNNGSFQVYLQGLGKNEAKFVILNSLGQAVLHADNSDENNTVNIQAFSPGIYYLQVISDNGIFVEKIIKE